jgi:beta-xylosidase
MADLLPMEHRVSGTYYRPKVVYNAGTNQYILWVNVLPRPNATTGPDFSKSSYVVATSPTHTGPFTIVEKNATTKWIEGGDFSLFVDDDPQHTGYLIYTSLAQAHSISIAPLNAAYTETVPSKNTPFLPGTHAPPQGCFEAPALFKRHAVYYALLGPCSCFGAGGSETLVYTANSPLGPYTKIGSLGNAEHAQQNYVFQATLIGGDTAYVWTGDRWKSTPDGEKAHDFQFWQPLKFSNESIEPLMSKDTLPSFELDLELRNEMLVVV